MSVLIPSYNEGDNAEETLSHALALDYPEFEVIAINDGSKDDTGEVLERMAALHPRLRVVHLAQNQGKAIALQAGSLLAKHEILICIDGDALLHKQAAHWFVRHFVGSPRVGAVTGNPRIRNRSTLLGRVQVGEFSSMVGMIKRAQRSFGRIFTVERGHHGVPQVGGASGRLLERRHAHRGHRHHLEAAARRLGRAVRAECADLDPDAGDAAGALEAAAALGHGRRPGAAARTSTCCAIRARATCGRCSLEMCVSVVWCYSMLLLTAGVAARAWCFPGAR